MMVLLRIVALFALLLLQPTLASAQSDSRSLKVWIDTLDLTYCGDHTFTNLGVWLEHYDEDDTVRGFNLNDSVLAVEIYLRWDTSVISLDIPYVLTPPQSVFGRFVNRIPTIDTNTGELYFSVATDASLKAVVGTGIPLFYLKGHIKNRDTISRMPSGGLKVQSIAIEGGLNERIGSSRFVPGFVQVVRDTTPEYTGALRATREDMDTNVTDTVSFVLTNVADKRVDSVIFVATLSQQTAEFVEVITAKTFSEKLGVTSSISLAPSRLQVAFTWNRDGVEIEQVDSVLIRAVLQRTRTSEFEEAIHIDSFYVNQNSCIGKLDREDGRISGRIIEEQVDTTDTNTVSVRNKRSKLSQQISLIPTPGSIILGTNFDVYTPVEIILFNISGAEVQRWSRSALTQGMTILKLEGKVYRGTYLISIQTENESISNKQIILTQ